MGDFYGVVKVLELDSKDFYLGSRTPTMLKSKDTTLILFYVPDDPDSESLKDIWAALGEELAGIDFAAVNGSNKKEVMKAFVETGGDPDHPLFPFRVAGFPTIMTYRGGWPQAYYNGPRTYDDLLDYCMELAWKTGYYEPTNAYAGVGVSRPELRSYEARTFGQRTRSDYVEQETEQEPDVTPEEEPGVLLTDEEAEEELFESEDY
jgi:hypothetical protein